MFSGLTGFDLSSSFFLSSFPPPMREFKLLNRLFPPLVNALTNGGNNLFNNLNSLIGGGKDDKKKDDDKSKPVNPLNIFGPILSPQDPPKKGDKPKE